MNNISEYLSTEEDREPKIIVKKILDALVISRGKT